MSPCSSQRWRTAACARAGWADHAGAAAGGRGVIDGLGKQLALPDRKLEPSYASLYWYGNTSSASTWYGLSFIEAVQRVRAGERVWQARPQPAGRCVVWEGCRWHPQHCCAAQLHSQPTCVDQLSPPAAGWRALHQSHGQVCLLSPPLG